MAFRSTLSPQTTTGARVRRLAARAGFGVVAAAFGGCSAGSSEAREVNASSGDTSGWTATDGVEPDESEDVQDAVEEQAPSGPVVGSGIVTVGGVAYAFEADSCFSGSGALFVQGLSGEAGTAGSAWVSVDISTEEDLDDDGEIDRYAEVRVDHGVVDAFGDVTDDDQQLVAAVGPFSYSSGDGNVEPAVEFELDGSSARGSGDMRDVNGISPIPGETVEFKFETACR